MQATQQWWPRGERAQDHTLAWSTDRWTNFEKSSIVELGPGRHSRVNMCRLAERTVRTLAELREDGRVGTWARVRTFRKHLEIKLLDRR